nr:hypothetical protein Iba_chr12dCG4390 [Ipomoea batatas]
MARASQSIGMEMVAMAIFVCAMYAPRLFRLNHIRPSSDFAGTMLRYLDEASCVVVLSNPGLIKKGQYVSWGPGLVASPYSASAQGFDILIKYSSPRLSLLETPRLGKEEPYYWLGIEADC